MHFENKASMLWPIMIRPSARGPNMAARPKDPSIGALCSIIDCIRLQIDEATDANAQNAIPALTGALHVLVSCLDQLLADEARVARLTLRTEQRRTSVRSELCKHSRDA